MCDGVCVCVCVCELPQISLHGSIEGCRIEQNVRTRGLCYDKLHDLVLVYNSIIRLLSSTNCIRIIDKTFSIRIIDKTFSLERSCNLFLQNITILTEIANSDPKMVKIEKNFDIGPKHHLMTKK